MGFDFLAENLQQFHDVAERIGQKEASLKHLSKDEKRQVKNELKAEKKRFYNQTRFFASAMKQYLNAVKQNLFETESKIVDPEQYKKLWQEERESITGFNELFQLKNWGILEFFESVWQSVPQVDLNDLPLGSFFLTFKFRLAAPFISKNDTDFYIIENPVRRDKVFQVPFIQPASWKGNLLAAFHRQGKQRDDNKIVQLFGNPKESTESFQAGRLHFYPSFFSKSSLEILNPQSRELKAGTTPVLLESVPKGDESIFSVLYVPFNAPISVRNFTPKNLKFDVALDLEMLAKGLYGMFRRFGFSAKKTSGFGTALEEVGGGKVIVRFPKTLLADPGDIKLLEQTFTSFSGLLKAVKAIAKALTKGETV